MKKKIKLLTVWTSAMLTGGLLTIPIILNNQLSVLNDNDEDQEKKEEYSATKDNYTITWKTDAKTYWKHSFIVTIGTTTSLVQQSSFPSLKFGLSKTSSNSEFDSNYSSIISASEIEADKADKNTKKYLVTISRHTNDKLNLVTKFIKDSSTSEETLSPQKKGLVLTTTSTNIEIEAISKIITNKVAITKDSVNTLLKSTFISNEGYEPGISETFEYNWYFEGEDEMFISSKTDSISIPNVDKEKKVYCVVVLKDETYGKTFSQKSTNSVLIPKYISSNDLKIVVDIYEDKYILKIKNWDILSGIDHKHLTIKWQQENGSGKWEDVKTELNDLNNPVLELPFSTEEKKYRLSVKYCITNPNTFSTTSNIEQNLFSNDLLISNKLQKLVTSIKTEEIMANKVKLSASFKGDDVTTVGIKWYEEIDNQFRLIDDTNSREIMVAKSKAEKNIYLYVEFDNTTFGIYSIKLNKELAIDSELSFIDKNNLLVKWNIIDYIDLSKLSASVEILDGSKWSKFAEINLNNNHQGNQKISAKNNKSYRLTFNYDLPGYELPLISSELIQKDFWSKFGWLIITLIVLVVLITATALIVFFVLKKKQTKPKVELKKPVEK